MGKVNYNSKEHSLVFLKFNSISLMLAAAMSQLVHPCSLLFDDSFEHFDW